MSTPPSPASRRARRAEALELFDDLQQELELVWDGSSPGTETFRGQVAERTGKMKRRLTLRLDDNESVKQGPVPGAANSAAQSGPVHVPRAPKKPRASTFYVLLLISYLVLQLTAAAARIEKVNTRFAKIVQIALQDPITKEEFWKNMQPSIQGTRVKPPSREEQEDAHLGRLLRGYGGENDNNTSVNWRNFMAQHVSTQSSLAEKLAALQQRNLLQDLQSRLAETDKALAKDVQNLNLGMLSTYIIHHVSVLSFGLDWQQITGRDSKKQKRAFYESAFQALEENEAVFQSLNAQQRTELMKNDPYKTTYTKWRDEKEPQMTARNRYIQLYLTFGRPLLMDPFWDVTSLTDSARTKEFPALLNHLCANIPLEVDGTGRNVALARWKGSRRALAGVCSSFDPELFRCVKTFCDRNPDKNGS